MSRQEYETIKEKISVIIFEVGWEQFSIELLDVKEIIQAGQIRRLPQSFEFIEGIYNYRGDIIHIVNLQQKLNLNDYMIYKDRVISSDDDEESQNDFIIIVNLEETNIGFLVDRILNVSHINAEDLIGLNPIFQTSIGIEYIKGIVKFPDRPRILINLNRILSESEQDSIQKDLIQLIK